MEHSDQLTSKSYRTYNYVSRYTSFPYYYDKVNDKYVYGTTSQLDDTTPYSLYITKKNDTYDSLALKFYNNPTLYWILCDFNRIQDPYTNIEEGTKLKIPSITDLKFS